MEENEQKKQQDEINLAKKEAIAAKADALAQHQAEKIADEEHEKIKKEEE